MNLLLVAALLALSVAEPIAAPAAKPDPWGPIRFLEGEWTGVAEGQGGSGTVHRTYELVLGGRFLHEKNVSTYPPQEKNKKGEVHEHQSFFSFDRQRGVLVLRQFHQEGFVNQFVHAPAAGTPAKLVFESEKFENFDNAWRARETYDVVSKDAFTETFELAPPGKPFEAYSKNTFSRVRKP